MNFEVFNLVSPLWRISRNPGNRRIWYAILFRSHRTILKTSIELISRNCFVIDWYRECQLFLISQKSLNGFTDCTWELLKVECGVHSLVVCSSVALKTTSICYQCPNYQCQNVYCAAKIAFFFDYLINVLVTKVNDFLSVFIPFLLAVKFCENWKVIVEIDVFCNFFFSKIKSKSAST